MKASTDVRTMVNDYGGILVKGTKGGTFGVNLVGLRIWHLAQQGRTVDEIIDIIGEEFGMAQAVVQHDVRAFLCSLEKAALVASEQPHQQ